MRRIAFALMLVGMGLSPAYAAPSEVMIVGGIDFGFKTLDLDTGEGGDVFSPSFTTINPHVALGYRSFYAALSYDRSIQAEQGTGESGGGNSATTLDYLRTDSTFTLGYRLNGSFNLFAGYTKAVNDFTETSGFLGGLVVTDISYTQTGPFTGVSYTKAFRNKGSLALSLGYAKLNGELEIIVRPGSFATVVEGDTTGLSYGLTWSGTVTGSLGYRVGAKATRYEMDEPLQITERYTSFFVGLVNYF